MDLSTLTAVQGLVTDTVVTLPARDSIALAADVAVLVTAIAMTILAIALLRMMAEWRHALRELRRGVDRSLGPVSDRARAISDNVEFITGALRTDVTRLNASVKSLTDRLHQASAHMEARIDEFNALMEVVQGEAEDIFLDTASTVRGVREGARSLGRPRTPDAIPEGEAPEDEGSAVALPDAEAVES